MGDDGLVKDEGSQGKAGLEVSKAKLSRGLTHRKPEIAGLLEVRLRQLERRELEVDESIELGAAVGHIGTEAVQRVQHEG